MNEKPSKLATALATALFKTTADKRASQIDGILHWHEHEERRRIDDANKLLPRFCDNTGVFRNRDRDEFFELQLLPPEPGAVYEVQFKRYAVPGRYWIYAFRFEREGSGRLVYGSEGSEPLAKSLKLAEADLNKPQVVDLFKQAFSAERIVCRYHHEALELLGMLAPKSKAYRVTHALCENVLKEREARFEADRAKRLTEAKALVAAEAKS